MRQHPAIYLLLFSAAFFIFCPVAKAQDISAAEANRLLQKLPNTKADTSQMNILLQLGLHYIDRPGDVKTDLDSALLFARQAESLSTRLKHSMGEGKSYLILSQVYRSQGNKATAKEYIDKAVAIFKRLNSWQELGDAYAEQKNHFDAFTTDEELAERIKIVSLSLALISKAVIN